MSIITLNTRSLPDSAVTTAKINADAVTDAKIADDVIGTEHLTAGEVDATALGADSVTAAKINDDIISGTTALASEPADTDEFLVSDAGTLKRIDYSLIKGGGITEADQWRLTSNLSSSADPISSNLERADDATFEKIGTGVSVSSGVWSFPSTGLWQVTSVARGETLGSQFDYFMYGTANDGTAWDIIAKAGGYGTDNDAVSLTVTSFFNCTNVSTHKIKFRLLMASGTVLYGNTDQNETSFIFIRLGDSQ